MNNRPTVCPFQLVAKDLNTNLDEAKEIYQQDPDDFVQIAVGRADKLLYKIDMTLLDGVWNKLRKQTRINLELNIQGYSL